jgi:hypothetical protein
VVHCGILQYSSPASSKLPQCATAWHLHPTLSRPISGCGSTHESAEGWVSRRMYFGMNRCRQPYFADVRWNVAVRVVWGCSTPGHVYVCTRRCSSGVLQCQLITEIAAPLACLGLSTSQLLHSYSLLSNHGGFRSAGLLGGELQRGCIRHAKHKYRLDDRCRRWQDAIAEVDKGITCG